MVSVIVYFFPIDQQDFIQINKHLIVSRDGKKDSRTKAEKNAVWWASFTWVQGIWIANTAGKKSIQATLMLRHWAHSIFCKEIRSARGIVVDRILLEYDLEWRDVPNLDISDENYEVQRGIWYWGRKWWATTSENSHQLMFVFYLQTVKTRPERDGLYPAVTTEGLLFSQTARETLGEYVETNEP